MSQKVLDVIVHGHFYQPPRENPWTGYIDIQSSAHPFANWNNRILSECYHPNAFSRVINEKGYVDSFVNNYSYFSFDIGPTLLDWIYAHDEIVYDKILEADAESIERLGYGNAMAQSYNHTILPLATENDAETQIVWGIEHFRKHFKRSPEAMWLPETAISPMVIKLLIKHGIQYTLLSPSQAHSVRPLAQPMDTPTSVQDTSIDTSQAYRVFVDNHRDEYLDILFYDFDLASAISFNHLLKDSHKFSQEIIAKAQTNPHPLVTVATDGETYGHHEPFGDMCFSYFSKKIAPKNNIRLVNGTYFLSIHPPKFEVILKKGNKNKGVSWSCVHGVDRWQDDCGCQTGGEDSWNQKWRRHLKNALDFLRKTIHEAITPTLKKLNLSSIDYRKAIHSYIQVISSDDRSSLKSYLDASIFSSLDDKQKAQLILLMEMEKYLLFMFTSCGWFFADISGIEPRQNLMYAQFALSLAQETIGEVDLSGFYDELDLARSNIDNKSALNFLQQDINNNQVGVFSILSNVLANKLLLKDNQSSLFSKTTLVKVRNLKHLSHNFGGQISITHKTGFVQSFDFLFLVKDNFSFDNFFFKKNTLENNILEKIPKNISTFEKKEGFISRVDEQSLSAYSTQEWLSLSLKKEVQSIGASVKQLFSSLLRFSEYKNYDLPPYFHSLFQYFFSSEVISLIEKMSFKKLKELDSFILSSKKLRFNINNVDLATPIEGVLLDNLKVAFKSQNTLKLSLITDYISILKKHELTNSLSYVQEFVFKEKFSPLTSPDEDWLNSVRDLCGILSLQYD